jgi:hypothetical protein
MNKKQWLTQFDITYTKFMWFFIDYGFGQDWLNLIKLRKMGEWRSMLVIMNNVWFRLPDNKFNIIENPPGWSEFLILIEE